MGRTLGNCFLCMFPCFLFAQPLFSKEDLQSVFSYAEAVQELPPELLPYGVDSLFLATGENGDTVFLLGLLNDGNFTMLQVTPADPETGWEVNVAKAFYTSVYNDGKINLCSQLPFRATEVCMYYAWDGESLRFIETEIDDPNWVTLAEADSCKERKDITCVVDAYNGVMYPYSYFSPEDAGLELLMMAYDSAHIASRIPDYKAAADIMLVAMDFYGTASHFYEMQSPENFNRAFPVDGVVTPARMEQIMSDYGLFLYKAGYTNQSITWNHMMTQVRPKLAESYLYLADTWFDRGDMAESRSYYGIYERMMKQARRLKEIPPRVKERIR